MNQERISSYQLCMLLTGSMPGSSIAFNDMAVATVVPIVNLPLLIVFSVVVLAVSLFKPGSKAMPAVPGAEADCGIK
jgi:hypothetical protein